MVDADVVLSKDADPVGQLREWRYQTAPILTVDR